MIVVSSRVFEKAGQIAEKFFETDHTAFYKFFDGKILTVTSYEHRVAPLGVAGAPILKPNWVLVEDDGIVFENTKVRKEEVKIYDPKVRNLNIDSILGFSKEKYKAMLKKVSLDFFEKILFLLNNKEYERIIGLGPGLTPLGDDVLSGMIIAGLKYKGPFKTNDISRQQLIDAMEGFVPLPVKVFLEVGDDSLLLNMGATSGIGWAFGITYELEGLR